MTWLAVAAVGLAAAGAALLARRSETRAASVPGPQATPSPPQAGGGAADFPVGVPSPADEDPLPGLASIEPIFPDEGAALLGAEVPELTLLAIQIEGLEAMQESFGDVARARAMLEVARSVRGSLRADDICARWENERLVALLPGISGDRAAGITQRLHDAVSSMMVVTHGGQEVQLTVLIGRASSPAEGASFPELLGAARRDLERITARLAPPTRKDPGPAERIRQAVPLVQN